jgi:hypothetical protein
MILRSSLLFVFSLISFSQTTTAVLFGTLRDTAGGAITGATITAEDSARGIRRSAVSDRQGSYRVAELPPGVYQLTASARDLQSVTVTGVALTIDSRLRQDFILPPAGPTSSITVTAPLGAIETESPALAFTLDQRRIAALPLNRRDFLQLSLLVPGVSPPTQDSELSTRGSFAMHGSGAREEFNNFTLDGADNNDPYTNRYVLQPSVDSILEFKILTNSYSAEYGRSAGTQVSVVTRTGSNEFHGTVYEYLRNRRMDARNFFEGNENLKFIRNQFGGSVGGPIRRDRAFFFANHEVLKERRALTRLFAAPAAAERTGDFSGSARLVIDPFTQRPFPNNRIPAERIHPVARRILALFPPADARLEPVQTEDNHNLVSRLDYQPAAGDQLTVRYGWTRQDLLEPFAEQSMNIPGFGNVVANLGHNAAIQHQRYWSAAAIQTTRFAFTRSFRQVRQQNYRVNVGELWGVDWLNVAPRDFGYPSIRVAGYSQVGDADQLPLERQTDTYQVHQQYSLIRGAHSLKFGGELRSIATDGFLDYFARGSLNFSGALTGSGLGDLLLGLPSFAIQARFDNRQSLRTTAYNLFFQNDFRLRPGLNVSLGLRYELNTPPTDPDDRMYAFLPATGELAQVGRGGVPRAGIRADRNNLAPRIGFAYSPTLGWSLRGGYGLFYDSGLLVINSAYYFNPPLFNVRAWFPTAQSLLSLSNPFPAAGGIVPPPSVNTLSPDLTSSYLQQWNLTIERQLSRATTASVSYAGSKGTHLIRSRDLNQPAPAPGDVQSRRPYRTLGGIFFSESGGNAHYQSLQLHLNRRFTGGISILASYTWSKSIDDASAFLGTTADKNFPQDSRNARLERARSSFDTPHRLSAAATWMIAGFELRAIATAQSGQPFTPLVRFDNSNTGNTGNIFGNDRPNLSGNPRLDRRTPERWFETSVFSVPPRYSFGNAGRNIVAGPGLVNFDAGLGRRLRLTEKVSLTLEAQAFNLANTPHFDLPERYVDEPANFGRIFSARAPRQLQVSTRLSF